MGSEKLMLPIIDFSSPELKQGTSTWESVKAEVRRSLDEFGCFIALDDKIPKDLRKQVFDLTVEFFDLSSEEKKPDIFGRSGEGYIGPDAIRTLHKSLRIFNASSLETVDDFISKIYPNGNSNVSKTIHSYVEELSELNKTIRMMVLESFGLQKYKDEHINSIENYLFFNFYKAPNTDEAKLGLPIHTDKNLITLLDQNGANGLEVLMKDDQWVKINFPPNSFIAIVGEMFHAWTNGRLHAPPHRVMMTKNESRYTLTLFGNYNQDFLVKAPEELVDEDHPQLYNPFVVKGLYEFLQNGGHTHDLTVKGYCGV